MRKRDWVYDPTLGAKAAARTENPSDRHKPEKRRTLVERQHDMAMISTLYLQGHSLRFIAAKVTEGKRYTLSPQTVANDIVRVREQWRTESTRNANELLNRELAKIDLLETRYWEIYESSVTAKTVTQRKSRVAQGEQSLETGRRVEHRDGNVAALQGVMSCIERRCKLLGLDAPEKVEGRLETFTRVYVGVDMNWLS